MQDYFGFAEKNDVILLNEGKCQFCGAKTQRGVHECLEIFNLGFDQLDFSKKENHIFRFLMVDAHALQHPEIHGRWSNHFHLSRLHLVFSFQVQWTYRLSPILSEHLNRYKANRIEEFLTPPAILERGTITTTQVLERSTDELACKNAITDWALDVYRTWSQSHDTVDVLAQLFLTQLKKVLE